MGKTTETKPITANDIMSDRQVAKLVGIAIFTLQRRMQTGFRPGEFDLTAAEPVMMGRRRWWLRADVERVIRERILVPARGCPAKAKGGAR